MSASVAVERAVFAQWHKWISNGESEKVAADLRKLLADTRPPGQPDPPSRPSAPPEISTR